MSQMQYFRSLPYPSVHGYKGYRNCSTGRHVKEPVKEAIQGRIRIPLGHAYTRAYDNRRP